ncbi:PGG domain - like 10 [Theobroma cacao]|nr:PGG domain - like 10 [Theobroma cacao]
MRDVSDESAGEPFAPAVTPSEEERTRYNYYRPLYLAALEGNWEAAEGYFRDNVPDAFFAQISCTDISLYLIRREPNLALATRSEGETILQVLAYEPAHFHDETKLNFWERWIYQYFAVPDEDDPFETSDQDLVVEKQSETNEAKTQVYLCVKQVLWRTIKKLVDYDELKRNDYFDNQKILHHAACCGVVEIVTASFRYFPDLIFSKHGSQILKNAIQYRQENIFNLACKSTALDKMLATVCFEPSISHLVAELPKNLTAILMFLSILTSSYKEKDFLRALPKRMLIGLASLFFAIATMMVAFGAGLAIVLRERFKWVWGPIMFLASFPATLFIKLQLPLFIEMVQSTYGSIFRRGKIW